MDRTKNTRNTDPVTSALAGEEVEVSGRAQKQRDICLARVRSNPGETAAEIALATGLERHVPSRRLPELRDENMAYNGDARKCNVMKRLSLTWYFTNNLF